MLAAVRSGRENDMQADGAGDAGDGEGIAAEPGWSGLGHAPLAQFRSAGLDTRGRRTPAGALRDTSMLFELHGRIFRYAQTLD
jgi:hypothetical protein